MRRIVTSATARTRLDRALEWLHARPHDAPLLLVAPTLAAGSALLREGLGERAATVGWERTTPARLLQRLCVEPLASGGLAPAAPLALEAVARRSIARARAEGALGRFETVAERDGFARCLLRTLQELGLAEQEPARVAKVVPELAALQIGFARELEATALADVPGLHRLALEQVRQGHHPLVGVPLLLVDLALDSPLERALHTALFRRSPEALCVAPERAPLPLDPQGAAAELDPRPLERTLYDDALRRLQAHLFQPHASRAELGEAVSVLSAPGEGRECVEIARRLLWAAEQGVPFERMAVLLRTPGHYRTHLSEALRRAGVPASFSEGSVRPDPAGRALLSLLRCKSEQLGARAFSEYLSLGVMPRPDEPASGADGASDARARPAPRHWERLLTTAAVVGGLERWRRRLSGLGESLALRLSGLDDGADYRRAALEQEIAALEALQAFALPLLERLDGLPERASWHEWSQQIVQLALAALSRPERTLEVVAELSVLGDELASLDEVTRVLQPRLAELRVAAPEETGGAVFVGHIDEARGRSFELVCIPGLAERIFPDKVRQDPILRDSERARIDPELTTDAERAERERRLLALAVGAAESRVVLSYPRIDTDKARPRVPSFYCLEVLRAAEGRLPGYDELMARAEQAADARIGWPAPRSARDAIDAAEHDLALLQRVLTDDDARSQGAMRYLLNANPHLARSLRFRARRWETRRWTSADGLVAPSPGAQAALAAHRLAARAYSATSLEQYAACPYRFLLSAVHGLSPRSTSEPVEEIDPLHRGAIVHDTQFAVLSALRDAGALPLSEADLSAAHAALDEALERVQADYHDRLVPAIERVWRDGVEAIRADLRGWLQRAAATPEWAPLHFELAFGLPARERIDPRSQSEPVTLTHGVRLRGAIDLVERHDRALRATDHKTGKPPARSSFVIDGGRTLQPVLYALALEQLFPDAEVVGGRLYFCTARGGFEAQDVPLDANARSAARELFETIDEALGQGFLPAAPEPGACEYCDYLSVCGPYEELRVQRKDGGRLLPLSRLREHP